MSLPGMKPLPGMFATGAIAYRYFRLNVSANNGSPNLLVGELKIFVGATDNPTAALARRVRSFDTRRYVN